MWMRWIGIVVLASLAVHSVAYGAGFVSDPVNGAREFGNSDPMSEAAENLTGLVGVILILLAATAVTAAVLVFKMAAGGAWLTLGLGIGMLSIGAYWAAAARHWDAAFYGAIGLLLLIGGALILKVPSAARE